MDMSTLRDDLVQRTDLLGAPFVLHSTWGLFSPRAIDEGSRLLLDHLTVRPDEVALDIGCGYGPLGLAIARQAPQGKVHLVDKDFVAVDYSRSNAERNALDNVSVYLSNALSAVPSELPLTLVVSNLPAKSGNELLYLSFIDSRARMQPGARIVVVTITGLRQFIKRTFIEVFGNYTKVKQGRSYTVSMAEIAS